MTPTNQQLDTIVRMVVERLRAMSVAADNTPKTEQRKLATFHEVTGKVDTTTLTLSEKVITTETLGDRLAGVSRVLVAKGSVVTPAARDWLRDRKVSLQVGGKPIAVASCPLVIGSDHDAIRPADVTGAAAANCLPHQSDWKPLLGEVTKQLGDSRRLGVIISTHAAAVLCLANRNPELRAIGGTDIDTLLDAKRQIGANLLVIDPTGRGVHAIRQMIATYARDGYLDPPRELEL